MTVSSTTRRTLVRLRAALLIVTLLAFGSTLLAFHRAHGMADTVHTRGAPALLELNVARAALIEADRAAINSLVTTESWLAGPGVEYQNQIAIASQNLTQVAEDNVAGAAGSAKLQLLQGLLVTYTGLIGQAHAQFQSGDGRLATIDLWYASRLLHTTGSGILAQLDSLLTAQKQALDAETRTGWVTPLIAVAWILSVAVLLGLLGGGQVFLRRRFRRALNPFLVLATVLLVALAVVASLSFVAHGRIDTARDSLYQVVDAWHAHTSAADSQGQHMLGTLVSVRCPGDCGATVSRFATEQANVSNRLDDVSRLTADTRDVTERAANAGANAGLEILIYLLAALIAGFVLFGLQPRIDEYRYRAR